MTEGTVAEHGGTHEERAAGHVPLMVAGWLWVGAPFGYGLYSLLVKIPALFSG